LADPRTSLSYEGLASYPREKAMPMRRLLRWVMVV
jgi:hypothetical protein